MTTRAKILLLAASLGLSSALRAEPPVGSPSAVAQEYYLAIGEGDLPTERSLYSSQAVAFFASEPPQVRAMMESGKTVTFGDTITGVDPVKENLQGDKAWVDVVIHYAHHADAKFNCGVMKENGVWKITTN